MADFISSLNGVQMDFALMDMAEHTSEAYAIGERNGVPVDSSDVAYHNNARYYAQQAQSIAPASVTEAVRWDIAQTALTDANKAQARENIDAGKNGAWTNPNLLDNPWWGSGEVVNQRGVTSGSFPNAYTIDRWYFTANVTFGTYSLGTNGITITCPSGATQRLQHRFAGGDPFGGKTLTASIMLSDGTILTGTITRTAGAQETIVSSSVGVGARFLASGYFEVLVGGGRTATIRAVKLELGSVSTLANDTPPDYGTELLKCMRYFVRLNYTSVAEPIGYGYAYAASQARILIPTPVPMRADPTISASATANLRINSNGTCLTPSGFTATGTAFPNGIAVHFGISGATSGALALLFSYDAMYIDFSADL